MRCVPFWTLFSMTLTQTSNSTSTSQCKFYILTFFSYHIDFKRLESTALRRPSSGEQLPSQLNVESILEALSPHFQDEFEFFGKLSLILNKVLT